MIYLFKKIFFAWLITLLFSDEKIFSQNLVDNPSFENAISCPDSLNQVYKAVGWYSVRPTPDYFNLCAPQSTTAWTGISIPLNFYGEQYPASGNAYAGFASYGTGNHRECIGTTLISPLMIDSTYYASFKVCLALDNIGVMCAVNKIGLLFTTQLYSENNPAPICNCSQIYADSIISDTTNWTRVTGSFVSDSAYTYLNIGNFFEDAFTDSILIHGVSCFSVVYFDDICVSRDSAYAYNYNNTGINNSEVESLIEIIPNPFNEFVTILNSDEKFITISLYSMQGQLITKFPSQNSLEITLNLIELSQGAYYLSLNDNRSFFQFQLIIKL